jgi:hypothetical protein
VPYASYAKLIAGLRAFEAGSHKSGEIAKIRLLVVRLLECNDFDETVIVRFNRSDDLYERCRHRIQIDRVIGRMRGEW